jgi:hypothetical protein
MGPSLSADRHGASVLRRLLSLTLLAGLAATAAAPRAQAHTLPAPAPEAAHYLTEIAAVTPALPGVTATVDPHGDWIQVSDTSASTLTILGYGREPYLRIDSAGVEQNVNSPSVYLNQALFSDLSQSTEENLPPRWVSLTSGRAARWHDHRIHWMGGSRPPKVAAHPSVRQVIGNWAVHLVLGSTPVTVTGTLNWLPLPSRRGLSTMAKIAIAIDCVVFVLGVAVIGWMRRRPGHEPDAWTSSLSSVPSPVRPPSG